MATFDAEDWSAMEQRVDALNQLVAQLQSKTQDAIYPQLSLKQAVSKVLHSQPSATLQPEDHLAQAMAKNGGRLGEESLYGAALVDYGESLHQMSQVKVNLQNDVTQNFVEPLRQLEKRDLKQVAQHRKNHQVRSHDLDLKRKKDGVVEEDLKANATAATDKLEEAKNLSQSSILNLLETEGDQIKNLQACGQDYLKYHQQSLKILEDLNQRLQERLEIAKQKPRTAHTPKRVGEIEKQGDKIMTESYSILLQDVTQSDDATESKMSAVAAASITIATDDVPEDAAAYCTALYDFEAQNAQELDFKQGDVIKLLGKLDDNWFEGEVGCRRGVFPCNYVQVN